MLILAFRVIDLRKSPVTKFLHLDDRVVDEETLHRAVRGHGNLIEYVEYDDSARLLNKKNYFSGGKMKSEILFVYPVNEIVDEIINRYEHNKTNS